MQVFVVCASCSWLCHICVIPKSFFHPEIIGLFVDLVSSNHFYLVAETHPTLLIVFQFAFDICRNYLPLPVHKKQHFRITHVLYDTVFVKTSQDNGNFVTELCHKLAQSFYQKKKKNKCRSIKRQKIKKSHFFQRYLGLFYFLKQTLKLLFAHLLLHIFHEEAKYAIKSYCFGSPRRTTQCISSKVKIESQSFE